MDAMRQAGELAKGGQPYQKATGSKSDPVEVTLESMGVTKHLAHEMRRVFALTPAEFKVEMESPARSGRRRASALIHYFEPFLRPARGKVPRTITPAVRSGGSIETPLPERS
jgi:hypothetical protein